MSNEQKVSIGRIVHYQAHGSPNGQHKSVPRAAIITGLHYDPAAPGDQGAQNNNTVDLCAINPTGGFFFNQACQYDADGGPGTWRWPPKV